MINDLIRKSIEIAKDSVEAERKTETERRLEIYTDNWKGHLLNAVKAQFNKRTRDNVAQLLDTTQNILKRVVYLVSQVYSNGVTRKAILNGNQEETDLRYEELMNDGSIDVKMTEVNRYTNLLGEMAIGLVPKNDKVELIIVTPDLITITQDQTDPTKIDSLTYDVAYCNSVGQEDYKRIYWDIYGNHKVFDMNGLDITAKELPDNPEGINPYKDPFNKDRTIIPFVVTHAKLPIWDFWGWTEGLDLVDGTLMCGVLLTYINYLLKVNSFKQLSLNNIAAKDLPEGLILDPLFPLRFSGEGAGATVLDFTNDPRPIAEVVKDKINALINAYGISGDLYRASNSGQSGYALKLSRDELYQRREEQVKVYKYYEQELFEKMRIVNNTAYPLKPINVNAEFYIDFNEMLFSESPDDIRKQWEFDIKLGVKSLVDYMIYINPDMTPEEAIKKLDENKRLNGIAKNKGLDVESILSSFTQQAGQNVEG